EAQVQDRGVEPLVLLGQPQLLVVQLDGDRRQLATVDDGRHLARATQAAARTLTLVLAAFDVDHMICHLFLLPGLMNRLAAAWVASPRPGKPEKAAIRDP